MRATRSPASSSAPIVWARLVVDTLWVGVSWFSAYALYRLLAAPEELVEYPQFWPYALAVLPVTLASAMLGHTAGLYRAVTPVFGARVLVGVALVRTVELAVLVAVLAAFKGGFVWLVGVLLLYGALALTSVLGWRLALRLIAPHGFDFSPLWRLGRPAPRVRVSVSTNTARDPTTALARARPRRKRR